MDESVFSLAACERFSSMPTSDSAPDRMTTSSNVKSQNSSNLNVRSGAKILLQIKIPSAAGTGKNKRMFSKNRTDAGPNVGD